MAARTIKYVPVEDLVPHERNPKGHDVPALKASIQRFGIIEPEVVDDRTGRLVSGHGRRKAYGELAAAQDEGLDPPEGVRVVKGKWLVPVVTGWASKDDDELEAAIVAVNRIGEGLWDKQLLADVLTDLADRQAGLLEVTGYDRPELDKLLSSIAPPAAPDAFPEIDPDSMPIDHRCPSCGYCWSGSPTPGGPPAEEPEPVPADA